MKARVKYTDQPYPANAVLDIELPRDPDQRVYATMQAIAGMVDEAHKMPYVVQVAGLIRSMAADSMPPEGIPADLFELFRVIRRRFAFKKDPPGVELVRFADYWADRLLRTRGRLRGDCDDIAAFAAAVVKVLGYQPSLIVTGPTKTGRFTHIFYGARIGGVVVPFDPQEMPRPGEQVEAERVYRLEL